MKGSIYAWALAAVLTGAAMLVPGRAIASPLAAPEGLNAALTRSPVAEEVALVCRRVWRCGPWGCGWRRSCWHTPGYGAYGFYGPRPNWGWRRHHWRHRHW
jgi:hypothetical protein